MIDLKSILKQHPEVIDDRGRLQSLLWELYPEEKRNVHILMALYDEGIIEETSQKTSNFSTIISDRLESDYGILPKFSLPMISLWKKALESQTYPIHALKSASSPVIKKIEIDIMTAKVGSICEFGSYWQGESGTEEKTPIEWLVLDVKGNNILLLSKYCLDAQPYNKKRINVTWGNSTLRQWLNNEFFNDAFSNEEKKRIRLTVLTTDGYEKWKMSPTNRTQDKVFLLSANETRTYFQCNKDRLCDPTKRAIENSGWGKGRWWWLRSPGVNEENASGVYADGFLSHNGFGVNYTMGAVRPAIWLSANNRQNPEAALQFNADSAKSAAVGDILKIGSYYQENSKSTIPVEWRVLTIEDGKALLISRYCLAMKPYNIKPEAVTWEKSTIRQWLNGEIFNNLFSQWEKRRILPTWVKAEKAWLGLAAYDTRDKLFLLSTNEAMNYFKDDIDRQCKEIQDKNKNNENMQWWLRSPGVGAIRMACIDRAGCISGYGVFLDDTHIAVRPALWLSL